MKKSYSSNDFLNHEQDKYSKFETMKEVLHFPSKQIKSNRLLNCFINEKFQNLKNTTEKKIVTQKNKNKNAQKSYNKFLTNEEIKINTNKFKNKNYNNTYNDLIISDSFEYNDKVGLNAPKSFGDLSYNNTNGEQNGNNTLAQKIKNEQNNYFYNFNNYKATNNYIPKKINKSEGSIGRYNQQIKGIKEDIIKMKNILGNEVPKNIKHNFFIEEYKMNKSSDTNSDKNNQLNISNNDIKNNNKKNKINTNQYISQLHKSNNITYNVLNNYNIKSKELDSLKANINIPKINKTYTNQNCSLTQKIRQYNNNQYIKNNSLIAKGQNIPMVKYKNDDSITETISLDLEQMNSPTSISKNHKINTNNKITNDFISNKNKHFLQQEKKPAPPPKPSLEDKIIQNFLYMSPKSPQNSKLSNSNKNQTTKIINRTPILDNYVKYYPITNSPPKSYSYMNKNSKKNKGSYCQKYLEKKMYSPIRDNNPGEKIYRKSLLLQKRKEKKLAKMRQKFLDEEMSEVHTTPKINKMSRKMSKNNLPIYKRVDEIKYKKKLDTERIKAEITSEHEYETTLNEKIPKTYYNEQKFNTWLINNSTWNNNKNAKMERLKQMMEQDKMDKEIYKFHPTINKNSEKIFYSKNDYAKYPIVERLYIIREPNDVHIKKIQLETIPSFKPEINKNYQIRNKYYEFMEEDQAQIYNDLKEKICLEDKKFKK